MGKMAMTHSDIADPELTDLSFVDQKRSPDRELELTMPGNFSLVVVGDCIMSRPLTQTMEQDRDASGVLRLLSNADLCCGNLETSIFEPSGFTGHPYPWDGDWPLASVPAVAHDLAHFGFRLMARANNHALDWGIEGMRETTRWLRAANIVSAGTGENLGFARCPAYCELPPGRVGLVSFATTFRPTTNALDPFGAAPGRPGISGLRVRQVDVVTGADLELIRKVRDSAMTSQTAPGSDPEQVHAFGRTFEAGDGRYYRFDMDEEDLGGILRNIRQGKQSSDLLVVMVHSHEVLQEGYPELPAPFLKELARRSVDAGADVFVTSGIHHLAPIEIYNDRPIFYGLGNFIWSDIQELIPKELFDINRRLLKRAFRFAERATVADLNAVLNARSFAHELAFESVIPVCRFMQGRLKDIVLHPIQLGYGLPLTQSGIPRLASGEASERILHRVRQISCSFGTQIEIRIEDNKGRILCA